MRRNSLRNLVRLGLFAYLLSVGFLAHGGSMPCMKLVALLGQKKELTHIKQTESMLTTYFNSGPNTTLSVSCALGAPNIAMTWEGISPDDSFYDLVGIGGSLVTQRPVAEVVKYSKQCRQEALKDESEIATIERKGMAIECQAFERDGGGTTITVFAE